MARNDHFVRRQSCPACGSSASRELYSAAFTKPPVSTYLEAFYSPQGKVEFDFLQDAHFILDRCGDCALVYQRMVPDDPLTRRLYEEWINPNTVLDSRFASRTVDFYVQLAREIERILWHFRVAPSTLRVLDFGMGWGEWCQMAAAHGCSTLGVELSRSRVEHARELGIATIDWASLPGHRFDYINAEQVFEHVVYPLETLRQLSGSLAPGGMIRISVPNGWDIERRLGVMDWSAPKGSENSLNPVAPLEHLNCFCERSLVAMAQAADLERARIELRSPAGRRALDLTLREILTPLYRWILPSGRTPPGGSTTLFFRRRPVS